MARLFDDASSEYLKVEQAIAGTAPFAVSIWFKRDADVECVPFSITDKDSENDAFVIQCLASGDSNFVRVFSRDVGGYGFASTSTGTVDNVWQHILVLFVSDTDRRVLLNNAGKGTGNTDITPLNMDRTAIGYWARTTALQYFSGDIAEVAIWDLSDWPGATASDKADAFESINGGLAKGFSPLNYPLGLKSHWNLIRGLTDPVGGYNLTANGTTVTNHPRIITPHAVEDINIAEAPFIDIAGTVSAESGASGVLTVETPLAGSVSASSGVTGSLSVDTSLAGSVTATSSVSGSLSVLTSLVGSITAISSATGNLYVPAEFTGTVSAESNVTGNLTVKYNLYASTSAVSGAVGSLNVTRTLRGQSTGDSNIAGSMGFTETRLQGSVSAVSGAAGSLSVLTSLAGSVTVTSSVSGVIYDVATITLAGIVNQVSSVGASLSVETQLAGSVTAVSGTADFLILNAVKFKGVVSAVSTASGYATCKWRLFGTIDAVSSLGTHTLDLYPDFAATTLFYRPQANITETLEWLTKILKSHDGTEQRIKVRQSPRQYFKYRILLDTNKLNTWMDSQVHGWLRLKWLVPIWTEFVEHTADINHHDATIAVDTTEADFRAGGKAIIWKSLTEYEVVKIQTVQDNQLTLNPNYGILGSFTGSKYIMPLREAYMTMSVKRERYNSEIATAEMVFKIYDNTNLTGWIPSANYDGMPILNTPTFMEGTHGEGSNPNNKVLDYQTGTFEVVNHADFNYTTQAHKFHNDTKAACWNFRKFLYSLNGKQKAVLIPTFRSDFVQSGTIVSGQTYVDIEKINLAANMGLNSMRTYIGFYFPTTGQLIVRKITDIAVVGPTLHATTERITFDADLGYPTILSSGDCRIGFVDKCRLESDKVKMDWEWTDKNSCDTKFARVV